MPGAQLPQALLAGSTREFPIEHLSTPQPPRALRPGERSLLAHVVPPWQREEVWDTERKRRFVEGIFLGLGTGYYVVHAPDWDDAGTRPMSGWLLDGQQRLTALRDFRDGHLAIFDGVRCPDLDAVTLRRRLLRVVFPCIELPYLDDEQRLRDLYERLNFGGMPHTAQDRARLDDVPPLTTIACAADAAVTRTRKGDPMTTFVFDVPITMAVTVQADDIEEARTKVQETIENKNLHIQGDYGAGYVTAGPDTGADFSLVDSYADNDAQVDPQAQERTAQRP